MGKTLIIFLFFAISCSAQQILPAIMQTAPSGGEPTFTDIQGKWGTVVSSGTTATVTLTSAPTTGNAVVCGISLFPNTLTINSISDGTNSYTVSANSPANGQSSAAQMFIAYLLNVPGGAGSTITVTASGTITFNSFVGCEEFHRSSGTWTFDTDVPGGGASGTAVNAPSITSAVSGELEVGMANVQNGINTANSPWTLCTAGLTSTTVGGCEYILSSSGSSTAMNFTASGTGEWNSMLAAFK